MKQTFAHLHNHTEFSMLDGLGRVKDYVPRAKKLGYKHLAITDHGNLMGAPFFYRACNEAGINPVLGIEFYFVESAEAVKAEKKQGDRFHVVFIARNEKGFRTIIDLSTESHKRFYHKPVIDRALLEALSKRDRRNVTVLSGCAGSIISQKALGKSDPRRKLILPGSADEEVDWWAGLFPNLYMELQHHDTSFDRKLNRRLVKLSKAHDLPWVITNDPHYVMEDECDHHDALLAIQTAADIDDPERFKFDGEGYHLKSPKEMKRAFKSYKDEVWQQGAANSLAIAEDCNIKIPDWDKRSWHIPDFPKSKNPRIRLRKMAYAGLKSKGLAKKKEYVDRVEHELAQFAKIDIEKFLLITADINQEVQRRGYRLGPGRGSVCGTLVGYLIGIHKIDSIKYDLLFERFLNPERPKMPDIDTDLPPKARDEMFQYAVELYGERNVMHLAAFQTLGSKRAFQSLGKAHGLEYKERLRVSDLLYEDEDGNLVFPEEIANGYPDLTRTLDHLVGLKSTIAGHPAGMLIFSDGDPIRDLVSEMWVVSSKKMVAQVDLKAAELLGLMKQDLLGLRTLDTVDECVRLVKERHGVELNPDEWVPDEEQNDRAVYRMLQKGRTAGIFQMEGKTNRRGIREINCQSFEDIVSCTSLYRAGPMIAGAPKRYLQNKADGKIRVAHKSFKAYLSKTWGEMIYQEQMFNILHDVAGFSWARVDDAKTAMARKDPAMMAALKDEAIVGFSKVGKMDADTARDSWNMIAAQASYLFNRSHAVAYSMLTYWTARLKYLYPLEYIAALLRTVDGSTKEGKAKRLEYLGEASQRGYKILPPDIRRSEVHMMPAGSAALRFGLKDIKGIKTVADKLITARAKGKVKSKKDVRKILNNEGALKALKESGALECFGVKTTPEKQEERLNWQFHDVLANFREKWGKRMRRPKAEGARALVVGQIVKIERKKTRAAKRDYMTWQIQWVPGETWTITIWDDASEHYSLALGSVVAVEGRYSAQWNNIGVGDPEQVRVLHAIRTAA